MKTIILLLITCCFTGNVMANSKTFYYLNSSIETIYLNHIKITYTKPQKSLGPELLSIYLDKSQPKPSYQHKIYTDKMMDANIYQDKLTIMFKIRNTYQLLILNHKSGQIIDNFWAAFAALSPDGRFVVYMKWQHRNEKSQYGIADGVTAVYDVTKSPIENRTQTENKQMEHSPISLTRASRKAGIPVYPLGDYNQPQYGWLTDYTKSSAVYDNYFWYQNNAFIFSIAPKKGMTKLVNAVYNDKQKKFVVKTYKVIAKDFMTSQTQDGYLPIKKIEKIGEQLKLFTDDSIIRLNNLNQLEQIE